MRDCKASIRFRPWLRWVVMLLLCLASGAAGAMPIKWRSANFRYAVDGKPIRDVLRDFGASQGMVVAVAADVEGSVVGKFDLTPAQFLDLLALSYGFVYYYNGAVLHVSAAQGMRSTLVRLSHARVSQLRETLDRMGVTEPRFALAYDEVANTALVAGPQEYVDVIREIAIQLEKRTLSGGRTVTRVFPLRFAWAGDRKTGAEDEVLPGMASLLQALYAETSRGKVSSGYVSPLKSERTMADPVAPALGSARAEKAVDSGSLSLRRAFSLDLKAGAGRTESTSFAPTVMPAASTGSGMAATVPPGTDPQEEAGLPVILANVAENSILVRDLPERMPAYAALIASLDIQPRMVEIAVQILDVSEDALDEFGVDWSLQGNRVNGRSASGPATGGGALLTAVVGNFGRALLARVAALEKLGRARVSARPMVATLNNVPAVMSSEKTFYVKVPGYQSSSLYNVSAGLDMKVTPMATAGPEGWRIRLDVQVRDGRISTDEMVGDLPTVTHSQLNTQAFVKQDESLLLAGYAVDVADDRDTGVPVLSRLPVLGVLFQQRSVDRKRSERLFLVTPRVLD